MSGIVGVFNRNGEQAPRETIDSMCDAINHRGPHGRGIWTHGPVGFGHVLLHTTEESLREQQPFSFDGRTWVTADARIDDRASLIDLLKSHVHSGKDLREATDVELLLHAYNVWGVDCVNHIIGVFAAAIWDGRKQHLICLRDHIGIKPFYYANTSNYFVFASEAKGILGSGLVPQKIYEPRIADFLVIQLEGVDNTCTFFEGVYRLPPAHHMVVEVQGIELKQYWQLDSTREILFKEQHDYLEAFREVFYTSVGSQLRGAAPITSMLSGGLDSSSIVAVARNIFKRSGSSVLSTLSLVNSKDENCRETFYVNQVLAQGGLKPCLIEVENSLNYHAHLSWQSKVTDDLFDLNLQVPHIMYLAGQSMGATVMLDGVDGDLIMGQPGNHIAYLLKNFKIKKALHEARCTRRFYEEDLGNLATILYEAFRSAYAPESIRTIRRQLRNFFHSHTLNRLTRNSIINKDFAKDIDLLKRFENQRNHNISIDKIDLRLTHANTLNQPYLVAALERYDRVASLYSIEPRHPIMDRRLVEFCLALPWEQKITNGWTKMIARRSLNGLLPEEVIWRQGREHLGHKVTTRLASMEKTETFDFISKLDIIKKYVDISKVNNTFKDYSSSMDESYLENWKILDAKALLKWLNWWK